jgi:hypothetical protein
MVWVNDRQAPMGQPNATGKPKALAIRAPVLLRLRHGCQKLSVNWMSAVSMKYTGKTAHELRAGLCAQPVNRPIALNAAATKAKLRRDCLI